MILYFRKKKISRIIESIFSANADYDIWNESVVFSTHTNINPLASATNNQTFIDSSTFNNVVTAAGEAAQGSASPYASGGASAYFDAGGDYLSIPNTNLQFGSNDFTFEAWVNPARTGNIFSQTNPSITSNNDLGLGVLINGSSNLQCYWNVGGLQYSVISNAKVSNKKWTHIAVSRSNGTVRLFVNGVLDNTYAIGTTVINTLTASAKTFISMYAAEGDSSKYVGHISDLRVVIGSCLYTTTFNLPTNPLTSVANTRLLLNFNNYYLADTAKNVVFKTNGVTVENPVVSLYGSALKFQNGNSLILSPGSYDSLDFGTGDFTVEAWVYQTGQDVSGTCIIGNYNVWTTSSFGIFAGHSFTSMTNYSVWHASSPSSPVIVSNTPIAYNKWTHIAVSRTSGVMTLFIDGVANGSAVVTGLVNTINRWYIGQAGDSANFDYIGYIDDIRITKGKSRYITNFKPRTQTYIDTPPVNYDPYFDNTVVLMEFEGNQDGGVFTELTGKTITNLGSFTDRGTKRIGVSSAYFNGYSCIRLDSCKEFDFGTGDFTVEAWLYNLTFKDNSTWFGGAVAGSMVLNVNNGTSLSINCYNSPASKIIAPYNFTTNTWYHVAICRKDNITTFYVNGKRIYFTTDNNNYVQSTMVIGACDPGIQFFTGSIDNFRATKGVCRYVNDFTPPEQFIKTDNAVSVINNIKCDPYWNNVTLSMDMQTTSDRKNNMLTAFGGIGVTTANKRFVSSLELNADGKYLSGAYNDRMLDWWSSNFTIECWINVSNLANTSYSGNGTQHSTLIGKRNANSSSDTWSFGPINNGALRLYWWSGVENFISTASNLIIPNQWHHIALNKRNNVIELYIDGVCRARGDYVNSIVSSNDPLTIGRGNNVNFLGYIEDLRFTKAKARYTKSFTPPTELNPTTGVRF